MTAADLVILGATVHTMDPQRPLASAVAVRDGLVVAVGDDLPIGSRTEVVDGSGLVVTPGLVDSHQHPLHGVADAGGVDAAGLTTPVRLRDLLRRAADGLPPDGWVVVNGVEYPALPDRPRQFLDDAVAGRPAFLWLADSHTALMSTRALHLAGITGPIDFGDRSEIVVDEDGVPTGQLHEMSAVLHGYAAVPSPSTEHIARLAADLFADQAACGITAIHVPDSWAGTEAVLDALEAQGRLPLRVLRAPWMFPARIEETLDALRGARADDRAKLWRTGAVKFFLDGTIDGGSAWLGHPDCAGDGTRPMWTDLGRYRDAVRRAAALGLPSFTHAIGDRAVTEALDTYQAVGRPARGRHRVEHAELLADDDVTRFAGLDVVASMQPTHLDWTLPDHTDNWSERLGPDRCGHGWRCADIVRAGGRVALGSDWPVAGYDPRVVMAGARLRRPAAEHGRAPVGADQALTARQSLAGYTTWAAYGSGEEQVAGRIREGFRADLTVFRGDPLTVPAEELADLPVELTVVAGRVAHRAG
ncbi:amidohydrolase [Actinosynnema sp. NPDC047251]|uniref:Amidohydrolase family protein n=1 Tax=Saccharothrix espanaensis (strain ATCC 51144 / DSM 44229 / JCM 9112 / NBRC 15066 / NRRL 15764) TaxID=1179773 RepID=K0K2E2_SACES|nr:amidohydrolase [Saccharothrix espanaensis]CCH31742.1 Amidohydrolase family protein [Saccharothrix espanaensis DSM 44229]